jgi:hypothetical protein
MDAMTGRWSRARPSGEAESNISISFQMISSTVANSEMRRKERSARCLNAQLLVMVKNGLDHGCISLSFPVALASIGVEISPCIVFNGGALLLSWVTGQECQVLEFSTSP